MELDEKLLIKSKYLMGLEAKNSKSETQKVFDIEEVQ